MLSFMVKISHCNFSETDLKILRDNASLHCYTYVKR